MTTTPNTTSFCSNPSSNSVTVENWELKEDSIIHGQVIAAFVLFYIVLGLPWNILVVITIVRKKLYHQPTIMLLLNLVLTDIMMLLFTMPVVVLTGFAGDYIIGSSDKMRCQSCLAGLIAFVLMMNSLFTVALMSIDRFLFIYKPLHYEQKATKLRTIVAIAVSFAISLVLGLLSLATQGTISFQPQLLSCSIALNNHQYLILLMTVACAALAVIIISNIWVIYIVQKNIKIIYKERKSLDSIGKMKSHSQSQNEKIRKKRQKKQLHLFRVFGGLLFSNLIAWLPLILLVVACLLVEPADIPLSIYSLVHILYLSQITMHPILETTLISDVREPMKRMVTCGLIKEKKDNLVNTEEDDNHDCCLIFKLINASVLPQDQSSRTTSTHTSDQNEHAEKMECGPADEEL